MMSRVRRSSSAVVILASVKTLGPFAEGEVGGGDDRGTLIKPTDEVEQELAAGLGEGQIAEFVKKDEVHAGTPPKRRSLSRFGPNAGSPIERPGMARSRFLAGGQFCSEIETAQNLWPANSPQWLL